MICIAIYLLLSSFWKNQLKVSFGFVYLKAQNKLKEEIIGEGEASFYFLRG